MAVVPPVRRRLGRSKQWVRRKVSSVPDLTDPMVADLSRRYSGHPASGHTHWTVERQRDGLHLPDFRSDNLYVWQRGTPPEAYAASWGYAGRHCRPELVEGLREDGAFGATTVTVDGRVLSRDLVDSVLELDFLLDAVPGFGGPEPFRVLDVGAGYGRLAHRATTALGHLDWQCVDAVPISTALCRHYLDHVGSPATVVELDRAEAEVGPGTVDLAVNVHSFNECPLEAIAWWARFLAERRVPWLFVVPNDTQWLLSSEPDGSKADYGAALLDAGYVLQAARHKYHHDAAVQRHGVYPETYLLFALRG